MPDQNIRPAESNLHSGPRISQLILQLFRESGDSQYGGEAVSQSEHGLQAAWFAEQKSRPAAAIVAALLHDVGHLLHSLPDDAPDHGVDDLHEELGYRWVSKHFGPEVAQPVQLHVAAKRYLCAVEPEYMGTLSEPSVVSLKLQGGPMSPTEVADFEQLPYFQDAVELRRFDDAAKVPGMVTPPLEHFVSYIDQLTPANG